ncbi:CMP/dCMP deaminase zinc-binding [Xanthobacter versatilis]|uniref:Cytidine deaminase n=1 Tax=Xanthobacter autotrophicus (strain ATCC BAA-1158 / Py2) TaxID=78245 RepID=A7IEK0_XANP2|nr:CMP/dCMP deaminase zinc-binding [Xanthobacter autotrophicus Py2]
MATTKLARKLPAPRSYDLEALFDAAKAVSKNAYAPYSRFRVGAALLSANGTVHVGCNVENIAYPIGTCAEAGAIAAARAAEGAGLEAVAIAIYAEKEGEGHVACTPCGACRQRILELSPATTVHFYGLGDKVVSVTAADLLPHAFTF